MKYSGKTVSKRCATESVAEIDDPPRAREAFDEGRAGRRAVDDHETSRHAAQQRRPLRDFQVGSDQVELGVDAVEGAVTDQEDEQQVVRLELRSRGPRSRGGD